jgi:ribonuclease HI
LIVEIHSDGGSKGNPGDAAAQVVINIKYNRVMTNNQAEYFALMEAIKIAKIFNDGVYKVDKIYSDSKLVVNQVNGNWRVNKDEFKDWIDIIRAGLDKYDIELCWLPREKLGADAR